MSPFQTLAKLGLFDFDAAGLTTLFKNRERDWHKLFQETTLVSISSCFFLHLEKDKFDSTVHLYEYLGVENVKTETSGSGNLPHTRSVNSLQRCKILIEA